MSQLDARERIALRKLGGGAGRGPSDSSKAFSLPASSQISSSTAEQVAQTATTRTSGGYARDSTWEQPEGYDVTSTTGTQEESRNPTGDSVKKVFKTLTKKASRKFLNVFQKDESVPEVPRDQANKK